MLATPDLSERLLPHFLRGGNDAPLKSAHLASPALSEWARQGAKLNFPIDVTTQFARFLTVAFVRSG